MSFGKFVDRPCPQCGMKTVLAKEVTLYESPVDIFWGVPRKKALGLNCMHCQNEWKEDL